MSDIENSPDPAEGDQQAEDMSSPQEPVWEEVLKVRSLSELFHSHEGKPLAPHLRSNTSNLTLRGSEGGVSKMSFPASEGQVFRAVTTVLVQGDGELIPVHFGPMFIDARDKVLFYSATVVVHEAGKPQPVEVAIPAPAGTALVRLRIIGAWAPNKDSSHLSVSYEPAQLFLKRN